MSKLNTVVTVAFYDLTGTHTKTDTISNISGYIEEYYFMNGVDFDEFEIKSNCSITVDMLIA